MYVCICKQVTDKQVKAAIDAGHTDLDAISGHLGLGTDCGTCHGYTAQLISEHVGTAEPVIYGE